MPTDHNLQPPQHGELTPGLVVAHSHRLEDLTEVAVSLMQQYPLAPLEQETVLVQSNGIAQWLKINVANHLGIAAMLQVTLPARFVWQAYRAVFNASHTDIPRTSPFDKERLLWRVMRILPAQLAADSDGSYAPLAQYLQRSGQAGATPAPTAAEAQRKLYQLSARIADLFDQYLNYRADWLDSWSRGRPQLDHQQQPVPDTERWQPKLWQALVEDIGIEQFWTNRAELHREFVKQARALKQRPAQLPQRILVFGISSLPQQTLEVLDALKGFTQIVLCVHNPCQHYWANIVDGKEALRSMLQHAERRHALKPNMQEEIAEDELHEFAHPLLAAWGKQGRDYIHLLDLYDETLQKQADFSSVKFELFDEQAPQNLLQQLQNDILHLRPLAETQTQWPTPEPGDHSIAFHSCHSVQREVEVLHDQLLAAFAADPQLRPRDVMVMVPDVNQYAAHVDAVFGRYDRQDKRYIPYTLADQGARHQQPLLVALELLLSIDEARLTCTDMMSLLMVPALQQRFALDETELQQLQPWLQAAGARWGLDAAQRAPFGMPADCGTNSWLFALQRMLHGYAAGPALADNQPRWHGIEPYDEVAGLAAAAVGKFADFIDALIQWWQRACEPASMTSWSARAEQLLYDFFVASNDAEQVLLAQVSQQLSSLAELVAESDFNDALSLPIFREAWLSRLDQPSLQQRFLVGSVNVATLMPMRAIPFKHIYVLGMNEGAYPRQQTRVDFDLMRAHYRPGDRSRRDDDRYLFLEALLSAREKFYVSWLGHSAQDNSEWPPSVLVAQLREHLAAGWGGSSVAEQQDWLKHLTRQHYLQPFHPGYFNATSPAFSYAHEWLAAHSNDSVSQPLEPLPSWQLEPGELLNVSAQELANFMRDMAEPFFTKRLETRFYDAAEAAPDSETFALDGLSGWQFKQQLLAVGLASLARAPADEAALEHALQGQLQRWQRAGELGVAPVSAALSAQLLQSVQAQLAELNTWLTAYAEPTSAPATPVTHGQLRLESGSRRQPVHYARNELGERLQLVVSASKQQDKHLFLPYVLHLLAPDHKTVAIFAPAKKEAEASVVEFAPLPKDAARQLLEQLLHAYERALSAPFPLPGELALQWLRAFDLAQLGKLKEGRRNLPAQTPVEAEQTAYERLEAAITEASNDNPNGDLSSWPYTARVAPSYAQFVVQVTDTALFKQRLAQLYTPFYLLVTYGQLPSLGPATAADTEAAVAAMLAQLGQGASA